MTPGGLQHLRRQPNGCAIWLTETLAGEGIAVEVAHHSPSLTVLDVRFGAPPQHHLPGYPEERIRVNVRADGQIGAVPSASDRRPWHHRYPYLTLQELLGQPQEELTWARLTGPLCLEYPFDPPNLRWQWDDGLHVYLRIVQRHLWSEEYWRWHGHWPVEDAPHGHSIDGSPHPILTPELKTA
jgi:hypothetical protein